MNLCRRHFSPLLWVIVVAVLCAPLAQSQTMVERILHNMDTNGDGVVTRKEWKGPPPGFARFDTNRDGKLTIEELTNQFGDQPAPGSQVADAPSTPWIDVHVHPIAGRSSIKTITGIIKQEPWARTVVMPTPQEKGRLTLEDYYQTARKSPEQFVYLGGGGTLNPMIHEQSGDGIVSDRLKERFIKRAEEIIKLGAVGFGEISILHVSLEPGHPYHSVPADHPLLLLLADIAGENDMVIDIHHDPIVQNMERPSWLDASRNPKQLNANMDGFERFLAHNRNAKIIWAHAGSDTLGHWTPELTRSMLEKHPNLYMSLRMGPGRMQPLGKNFPMSPQGIKLEWLSIFQDYSDRFVIGNDQFFEAGSQGPAAVFSKHAQTNRNNTVRFLSLLPKDLAREIGYENAQRLYKFKL